MMIMMSFDTILMVIVDDYDGDDDNDPLLMRGN